MTTDNRSYWYNFKTDEYDYIETPTDFVDYIPNIPAAHSLYSVYLEMGKAPLDAALETLKACIGEKAQ